MNNVTIILGGSADIGGFLVTKYLSLGHTVFTTCRNDHDKNKLISIGVKDVFKCDFSDYTSVEEFVNEFRQSGYKWNNIISSVGTMLPIGNFLNIDFKSWEINLKINSLSHLFLLNKIWKYRDTKRISNFGLLAGGGTNNAFKNYSAYCLSKIMLIKACELLDDENEDLNIFIVGPGYVKTKIHNETLENKDQAGENYHKTKSFLESQGTPLEDIFDSINWCIDNGKGLMSGRNLSTVGDEWKNKSDNLINDLKKDQNLFKLRRKQNDK